MKRSLSQHVNYFGRRWSVTVLERREEGSVPKLPEVGQTPASRMQAVGTRVDAAFLPALGVCRRKRGEAIGEKAG